jgi:hypothetical protein
MRRPVRTYGAFGLVGVVIVLAWSSAASAATIVVHRDGTGDFTWLQPALNAAADGDTILLGPGDYFEQVSIYLAELSREVPTCGFVTKENLTLIGSGIYTTRIGPNQPWDLDYLTPQGLTYSSQGGHLTIRDLMVWQAGCGVFVHGPVFMDNCRFESNAVDVYWAPTGVGGWLRDIESETIPGLGGGVMVGGTGGAEVLIERYVSSGGLGVTMTRGLEVHDSVFANVGLVLGASVSLWGCRLVGGETGIQMSAGFGSYCEIHGGDVRGTRAAVDIWSNATGGRIVASGARLTGGSQAILNVGSGAGVCEIHGCDLIRGSGQAVVCGLSTVAVTHLLTDNYWGTADDAAIQSWITDHADNPGIGATVLYSPFAGQSVPTESTSWGDLKALFR